MESLAAVSSRVRANSKQRHSLDWLVWTGSRASASAARQRCPVHGFCALYWKRAAKVCGLFLPQWRKKWWFSKRMSRRPSRKPAPPDSAEDGDCSAGVELEAGR